MAKNTKAKNELVDLGNALGVEIKAIQVWLPSNVARASVFADHMVITVQIFGDHRGDGISSWRTRDVSGSIADPLRTAANAAMFTTHKHVVNAGWFQIVTRYGKLTVK